MEFSYNSIMGRIPKRLELASSHNQQIPTLQEVQLHLHWLSSLLSPWANRLLNTLTKFEQYWNLVNKIGLLVCWITICVHFLKRCSSYDTIWLIKWYLDRFIWFAQYIWFFIECIVLWLSKQQSSLAVILDNWAKRWAK